MDELQCFSRVLYIPTWGLQTTLVLFVNQDAFRIKAHSSYSSSLVFWPQLTRL